MKYKVKKEELLLNFLLSNVEGKSKNNIKSLLKWGNISVNGNKVMKHDFPLSIGDEVSVSFERQQVGNFKSKINIIYEDVNIIVVDKPSGLLSVDNDKASKSLFSLVQEHLKNINKNNKLYLVHRLDKDTSGVIVFAKSVAAKKMYQENWDAIAIKRGYKAVVINNLNEDSGILKDYLVEKGTNVYVTKNPNLGKEAITKYKVIKKGKGNALVSIELETGRKNQIRVQFADRKSPVLGDRKYGDGKSGFNRLALHADVLELRDPFSKKKLKFESQVPSTFHKLV